MNLNEKMKSLSSLQPKSCIFKVHDHLREVNKKSYEPEIIAIGPYHRKKKSVSMMEEHKLRYLHIVLQRKKENVETYCNPIKLQEKSIRECYAEPTTSLDSDQLVEMMTLDGIFIVELVRKYNMIRLRDKDDPIFEMKWIMNSLQRDLMLFENQVPFFVLRHLFGLIEGQQPNDKRLNHLLLSFFSDLMPDPKHKWSTSKTSNEEVKHLLDLIHIHWYPLVESLGSNKVNNKAQNVIDEELGINKSGGTFIRCVTQLREAGIKFEKKDGGCFFNISFKNGTLQIPPFNVEDRTDSILRNLVAHEQYCKTNQVSFVTNYVNFLDCLIDSSKDVEILSRYGIIDNWLGDGEVVSSMFNKITDCIILQSNLLKYGRIFKEVNAHCNKRRNRWMAKLRRNYLDSPWGLISILAAIVLLLLTFTQTIFTVFPRG